MQHPRSAPGARALLVLLGGLAALALPAPAAWADGEDAEARLARLEALLEQQAREIEALRRRVGAAEAAPAPTTAPDPSRAQPPAPPSAPPDAAVRPPPPAPTPTIPAAARGPAGPPAAWTTVGAARDPAAPDLVDLDRALGRSGEVVATHGGPFGLRWGGYLTLEYIANSERNSYLDLHRLVLAFDAAIGERIDVSAEIEYEHGGVSDELDGEIVIEQLPVRFQVCDAFVPKLGVLLIPFGRYNLHHDDPLNDFTVRPWTARYLVPTGFGQPGIGAEGAMPFGAGHVLAYDVAVTAGYRDGFTTDEGVREARQVWKRDNNENKQVWGRAAGTFCTGFLDHLEVGLSGTWGAYDDAGDRAVLGYAIDGLVRKGPFEVKGEWIDYHLDREASDPDDDPRRQRGLWVEGAWHFMPCRLRRPCAPFVTDTSHFTLAVRYQWTDLNDRLRGGAFQDDAESIGVGLNYRITERTVFRVDCTWIFPEREPDETELTASFSTYF